MWGFAVQPPRMVEAAPKHDEFFLAGVRNQAHSLVRELTQNTGDAAIDPDREVLLTFRFLEVDAETFASRYLKSLPGQPTLNEHLLACKAKIPASMEAGEPVPVLVIEDFATKGLTGSYNVHAEDSSFLAFWKRYGTSNKGNEAGGRHGIGKSVLPSSSLVHAFFGLTHRSDDGRELFMGQVVLKPHRIEDVTFDSFGQFSPSAEDVWALPYEDSVTVSQAKHDFQLQRGDQSGLSLMVPWPREEVTKAALMEAAVEQCFHQILTGRLSLEIGDVRLAKDTLLSWIADNAPANASLAAAAKLSAEAALGRLPLFEPREAALKNRLTEESFEAHVLEGMRTRFREGETVRLRLPVEIRSREARQSALGEVSLYLRRVEDAASARETYVRGRVTVPNQGKVLVGASTLGLLVADDLIASKFLGDSEDVAHTKWVQNKLFDKYLSVPSSFNTIRYALRDLQKLLVDDAEDRHIKDALKHYFWQPKPSEAASDRGDDDDVDVEGTDPPAFRVEQTPGGFTILMGANPAVPIDAVVEVAYAVRRGKAKWSPSDFEFGKSASVATTGNGEAVCEGNRIRLRGAGAGFRLEASGFDPNRDLIVNVRADAPGEEG